MKRNIPLPPLDIMDVIRLEDLKTVFKKFGTVKVLSDALIKPIYGSHLASDIALNAVCCTSTLITFYGFDT